MIKKHVTTQSPCIEELRDVLSNARRSLEHWREFLDDFVNDPEIIARFEEIYHGNNQAVKMLDWKRHKATLDGMVEIAIQRERLYLIEIYHIKIIFLTPCEIIPNGA